MWRGDVNCKRFLNDLKEFWTSKDLGYEYEEFCRLQRFLESQELVEIVFGKS